MQQTAATILCAICGIKFIPTSASICPTCTIKSIQEVKILQADSITHCRYCLRYERPPWMHCERESQEMLAILLKKIKGLNKVEFQSASFLWTEPHSKRIKLKVVYNRQVNDKMKLECIEVVQFIQKYSQCPDCKKKFTPHDWVAVVQIRQFSHHKKTILNLEQTLLKTKISDKVLKSQGVENGLDVFFSNEHDAQRLVDFLKSRYPTSAKQSKQLISHNQQNNTSTVKITFSVIIPKICKDDLIRIPTKLSKQLGSCSQALFCTKVGTSLYFIDITNFKKIQINATQYNKYEGLIEIFPLKLHGRVFNILDSEENKKQTIHSFPIFGLSVMKQDQYKQLYTRCFFTDQPGRDVFGFDFSQIQNLDDIKNLPDIFIAQKIRNKEQKKKNRAKKRQKLAKQKSEALSQAQKTQRAQQQALQLEQAMEQMYKNSSEDDWEDEDQEQEQKVKKQQLA